MNLVPERARRRALTALLVAAALFAQACSSAPEPESSSAAGLDELAAVVASYDLAMGTQRFMAGVVTPDQVQVGWGEVKMKFAYLGDEAEQLEGKVSVEATARYLPIPAEIGKPAPESRQGPTLVTGAEGRGVYSAEVTFDKAGFWGLVVEASVDGGEPMEGKAAFEVLDKQRYPSVGEDAPKTENLTLASSDVPKVAIDSRAGPDGEVPNQVLHQKTVAESIASGKPTLLVVSTPVYCVSRFCGPVTDVVADISDDYPNANFVHIEIWRDFQNQVVNQGAAEWVLRDKNILEPWVFLIGGDGKIVARWDNVATRQEIEPALQSLLGA